MRSFRKLFIAALVIVALPASMAFANGAKENQSSSGTAVSANQPIVIGVSLDSLFPGRNAEMVGIKAAAKAKGVTLKISVADNNAQKQNAQIESFINQHVKVIMIVAVDNKAILTGISDCKRAGIPVVTFDRKIPGASYVSFHAGLDSYADGMTDGKYVAKLSGGKAHTVLELLGALNDDNAIQRRNGFEAGLKSAPNLKIIRKPTDWNANEALKSTENALTSNPNIWAIQVPSDFMMDSIKTALKENNMLHNIGQQGHVIVTAIDGSAPGYQAVKSGWANAVVVLPLAKEGAAALDAAILIAKGGTPAKKQQLYPGTLYTHANIAAHASEIWGAQQSK